ncbi:MAG: cation transporter [FCB group bacterium]|nr:cation transporter [FCB group bacterium]
MLLTEKILKSTCFKKEDIRAPQNRAKVGILEGWVSIILNTALFLIKLLFSLITGSLALMADAFHTLSDVITSGIIIVGFKISHKPADREHPFGHGRAEMITTLTVALLIGVVGFEFLKSGILRLVHPVPVTADWLAIAAVIFTIVIKELLSQFSYQLGEIIDSNTLRGDALHHRSDAISSVLVVIALISAKFNFTHLDGIMGIAVAGFMLYSGFDLARSSIDDLLGRPISPEMVEKIRKIALAVDGALNVHDVIVHSYGNSNFISLHVEVPDTITPGKMHTISDQVERDITRKMNADVVTHIDPVTMEGEIIRKIKKLLKSVSSDRKIKFRIQDLRVVGQTEPEAILFELPVPIGDKSMINLKEDYIHVLRKHFPRADILIDLKPQLSQ